jgi:hypothetical protein
MSKLTRLGMDLAGSDLEAKVLIISNLMPLVSVLLLGGDLWFLLILYWLENFIAGGFNILMILTSTGRGIIPRLFFSGFFAAHYGLFTFVHLFFIIIFLGAENDVLQYLSKNWVALGLNIAILSLSYAAGFVREWLPRRDILPEMLMSAPYGRIVLLQCTIIFGAFLTVYLGASVGFLVILVLLKTGVDVWLYFRSRVSTRVTTATT